MTDGWDTLSKWQWEATCGACRHDEHEECTLAVRVDDLMTPCSCGCREAVRRPRSAQKRRKRPSLPRNPQSGSDRAPASDLRHPSNDAHLRNGREAKE